MEIPGAPLNLQILPQTFAQYVSMLSESFAQANTIVLDQPEGHRVRCVRFLLYSRPPKQRPEASP
jgi:hypothetical protein